MFALKRSLVPIFLFYQDLNLLICVELNIKKEDFHCHITSCAIRNGRK